MEQRPSSHCNLATQEFVLKDRLHAPAEQKILLDLFDCGPWNLCLVRKDISSRKGVHTFLISFHFLIFCRDFKLLPGASNVH
jgi:hypothetical protein